MLSLSLSAYRFFDRAMAFYSPLMEAWGLMLRLTILGRGLHILSDPRPLFCYPRPFNTAPHHPGNGQ